MSVGTRSTYGTSVRVDHETAEVLRRVSVLKGISIGEYLRDVITPVANRDLVSEARKIVSKPKPPASK